MAILWPCKKVSKRKSILFVTNWRWLLLWVAACNQHSLFLTFIWLETFGSNCQIRFTACRINFPISLKLDINLRIIHSPIVDFSYIHTLCFRHSRRANFTLFAPKQAKQSHGWLVVVSKECGHLFILLECFGDSNSMLRIVEARPLSDSMELFLSTQKAIFNQFGRRRVKGTDMLTSVWFQYKQPILC